MQTAWKMNVYSYVDVGILLRKKMSAEGKLYRYIDQVCFFVREEGRNEIHMQVVDGQSYGERTSQRADCAYEAAWNFRAI